MRPVSRLRAVGVSVVVLACGACDMTRFTANQTADMFERAAPAFDQHWDYQLAGDAAPGSIMQLEGILRASPENETLLLSLTKAYTGYAFGWVEDELERTDPMDFEREEYLRHRARLMYLRARNFAFRIIRLNEDGFDAARQAGLDAFERWLAERFDEPEDAEILLWAGYSWGSAINVSRDDPEMIADLAFARALVERSVHLDESYYQAAGLTFLATMKASFPEALGGDPEAGRELFERALTLTHRNRLVVQVMYARTYAAQTGNRELYEELLNEVMAAGDVSSDNRLLNKIARRRAQRYLRNIGEMF